MESGRAVGMLLLLATLLLLAQLTDSSQSYESRESSHVSSDRHHQHQHHHLDSRKTRDAGNGGAWLPVELLADDDDDDKPVTKHKHNKRQHRQHSPEEEEHRRRLWEQQERRRVDEERRRAHEPPRPEEPPQPTTRRPTYEERLREWQRQKEEHDRLVREREKEYEALTVRPLGPPVAPSAPSNVQRAPASDEEENERKLQDYIERNTPINAHGRGQLMAHSRPPASRQPYEPYEPDHARRPQPAQDNNGNGNGNDYYYEPPSRHEESPRGAGELTPEDERQIAEYHERLEMQLAQLHGPARQEFERQARQREDEYRSRLQQDHLREKTGCNQTTTNSGVKGLPQRRPAPASSSLKGAYVDPCASGPYPPYGDARYSNRGPDGRPCPPPSAAAASRGETKGPSNDLDPYEQYRRGQESRYRPEQSKGPDSSSNYEEQRRAADARYRAEQNKGPVVDPYAELRRADEARYLAQQNKGPQPPAAAAASSYEELRRAQEDARYRAEQNKGGVQTTPEEPDWRRYEEMRRAEDASSSRIQPAASKGAANTRDADRQETLQPEVWNRVYQASYHRGDPDPARPSHGSDETTAARYNERPAQQQSSASNGPRYGGGQHHRPRPDDRHRDNDDDDSANSNSDVRYEEQRRNEAVAGIAPGEQRLRPESYAAGGGGGRQQQRPYANQTQPITAAAATTTMPTRNNNGTRSENSIDFMRGLRPDRSGHLAMGFPAAVTPRPPPTAKSPSACVWAVVVCCRVQREPQKLVRCFEAVNCPDGNWDEGRCAPPIVGAANHEVGRFYRGSAAANSANANTTTTTATAQRRR